MSKKQPLISSSQLFCLLLLSRLTMEIISPLPASENPLETLAAVIVTEGIRLGLALPLIFYSFAGSDFYRAAYKKSRLVGYASALFGAALLIFAAVKTVVRGAELAEKNLLSGRASWIIFVAAILFALYAAYMGAEALARAGVLFLVAAGILTVIVFAADIPYMRVTEMWRGGRFTALWEDVLARLSNGGEYLVFAALLPFVRQKEGSSAGTSVLLFTFFSTAISCAFVTVNYLVLREMYPLSEYPFIALASLSDVAMFKRLDGAFAAVWELCGAFRGGLLLLSAGAMFISVYRARKENTPEKPQKT